MNYITFPTAQSAVEKIAQEFALYSQLNRPVHISLSGGSTPKLLFKTLAQEPYKSQIQWQNLHFWWGDFEQELSAVVSNGVFDWIILGMGTDGHTASLFPHQTDFNDPNLAVVAKHPETGQIRISKTAKLIEQAKRITYLVTGASKAEILKEIQTTQAENLPYPAARIKAKNGVTEWYLDKDAAKLL